MSQNHSNQTSSALNLQSWKFTEMTDVHANVTDLRRYKKGIVTFNRLITNSSNTMSLYTNIIHIKQSARGLVLPYGFPGFIAEKN